LSWIVDILSSIFGLFGRLTSGSAASAVSSAVNTAANVGNAVVSAGVNAVTWVADTAKQGIAWLNGLFKYHDGGRVGAGGRVRPRSGHSADEVMAILQVDEVVLTKTHQERLLTQMDFLRELGANANMPISFDGGLAGVLGRLTAMPVVANSYGGVSSNDSVMMNTPINVLIQHSGSVDDAAAARFGEKIAQTAAGSLYEAFRQKGVRVSPGNAALKAG
jgi:hypothetical protein